MAHPTSSNAGRPGRRANGVKSREAILDAAEELMAERGFAGTGISAISKRSGLPASSIYWFFENKESLAAAVVERAMERWTGMLADTRAASRPGELLAQLLQRAVDEMRPRLPLFLRLEMLLALERGAQDPALLELLRRGRESGRRLTEEALVDAFADLGEGSTALAEDLSTLAIAMTQGALVGHLVDPERVDLDRFTEELGIALRAIAEHRLCSESA